MAEQQKRGKEFENKIAEKLKKMQFEELSKEKWSDYKNKHNRCFTKQFASGRGLYVERKVDFRVKHGCCEFDVEAKYQDGSGTADRIAWVELKVAERNRCPLYLVIGGKFLTQESRSSVLKETAKSSCYDHLRVGTLDEFAATLDEFAESLRSSTRSAMPLSRFTVLDLTRVRAGPTAVRQLADWGANVIRIEAPAVLDKAEGMGGARHGPDFQNLHRNKRAMTLNLKHPDGRVAFLRLVERADVVVENYRPDVKSRLGIDYPECRAVNPRIVYASISGFGQDGPYRLRPGFDQIAQGMGGLMWITGLPGQGPVRVGVPIADLAGGLYAAIGIFVALLEREETGEGRWVHSSLLEAQIAMLDFQAARWTIAGEVPPQAGNNHPTSIPTGVFETADGYINIAASGDGMWQRLCEVLGDAGMRDDPRFATGEARSENRDRLNEWIQAHLRGRPGAEWIEALNEAGVPCGPIYRMDEMWADPQVKHLRMQRATHHPALGEVNVVRNAVNVEGVPPMPYRHTAERGEHTDRVLAEFGFTAAEIEDMRSRNVI